MLPWHLLALAALALCGCHLALPYESTTRAGRDALADRAAADGAPPADGATCTTMRQTFIAVADTTADDSSPDLPLPVDDNTLAVGTYFEQHAYLAFDTSALPTDADGVTLELYVTNSSGDGPRVLLAGELFAEDSLTWGTRPTAPTDLLADIGAVAEGWVSVPLLGLASGPRPTLVVALVPHTARGLDFHSREGANPPRLRAAGATSPVIADTFIDSRRPRQAMGSAAELETDWQPNTVVYLRFDVAGLAGEVTGATLRVFTDQCSDPAEVYRTSVDWDEAALTWNRRPPVEGAPLGTLPCSPTDAWVSSGLGPIGPGPQALAVVPTGEHEYLRFSSREGAYPPELVVETARCD